MRTLIKFFLFRFLRRKLGIWFLIIAGASSFQQSYGFNLSSFLDPVRLLGSVTQNRSNRSYGRGDAPDVLLPPAGSFDACRDVFPRGRPFDISAVSQNSRPIALCSNDFAVLYSGKTKTPLIVFEKLNASSIRASSGLKRTDAFFPDPRISRSDQAQLDDYRGSGWQRGHMSPAADQSSAEAMEQSFNLSNIVPQDGHNNEKVWAKVEADVRKYAKRAKGDVFVFTGPLFKGDVERIGRNNVWVPSHLFKLVFDESNGRSWAYIVANNSISRVTAPINYDEFTRNTGWHLLD